MSQNKYAKGDKLEVFRTPPPTGDAVSYDGEIVIVLALPGYSVQYPGAYGVLFKDGILRPIDPFFLRPYPPSLPNGRGDIDTKIGWAEFDKVTGLDSSLFRYID